MEEEMKKLAEQIRDERATGANTAERVGGLLVAMCEAHGELKAEAERIAAKLVELEELQAQDKEVLARKIDSSKEELTAIIEEKEASLKADIVELNERITVEHAATAELVESVRTALLASIEANKTGTDEALDAINTTIGEIQAKIEEHKATMDNHGERITAVEGSVEAIREDAEKAREDADAARQSAEQANTRLGEINNAVQNLSPEQQAALALSEKVEGNTAKNVEQDAKLSELEIKILPIKHDVDDLKYEYLREEDVTLAQKSKLYIKNDIITSASTSTFRILYTIFPQKTRLSIKQSIGSTTQTGAIFIVPSVDLIAAGVDISEYYIEQNAPSGTKRDVSVVVEAGNVLCISDYSTTNTNNIKKVISALDSALSDLKKLEDKDKELSEQVDSNSYRLNDILSNFEKIENITERQESKSSLYVDSDNTIASGVSGYRLWSWYFDKDTEVTIEETIEAKNSGSVFIVNSESDLVVGYVIQDLILANQPVGQSVTKSFIVEGGKYLCIGNYITSSKSNVVKVSQKIKDFSADTKRKLKILCFGNSFTQDAFMYAPSILEKYADIDITIGIGYISGSPLAQHCANLTGETQTTPNPSGGADLTFSPVNYTYQKHVNGNGKWTSSTGVSADRMLADEEWDMITFQQGGNTAFLDFDTHFKPFIDIIHKAIYSKVSHPIKLGWLLTHGSYSAETSYQHSRWVNTAKNAEKIMRTTPTEFLLPYGTAVAIARTTSLSTLGDDGSLMADHIHLQEGIPSLIAAYTAVVAILKELNVSRSIIGDTTNIDDAFLTEHNILGQNYGSGIQGMNAENRYIAQKCAIQAVKYPFGIDYSEEGLVG